MKKHKITEIRLIEQDFDVLTDDRHNEQLVNQFTEPLDCPIARACKRMGLDVVGVLPFSIELEDGTEIGIDGYLSDVVKAANEIMGGAPFGTIKIRPEEKGD